MKRLLKHLCVFLSLGWLAAFSVSCAGGSEFTQQATTQSFTQSYNPQILDILFMVSSRSPMSYNKDRLVAEASNFFARLDSIPAQYRVGVVTHSDGQLIPKGNPYILEKKRGVGTPQQRASIISSLLNLTINLKDGAIDTGFQSAWVALNGGFKPTPNVPLVLVFISDSDDHSPAQPGVTDVVDFYGQAFLSLKANNPDLLRVYSINYLPLGPGEPKTVDNRCATFGEADIDKAGFQDRYFELARGFGGVPDDRATAGLCGPFASQIDLTGLRLRELPKRFKLTGVPQLSSLIVSVVVPGGQKVDILWTYDAATNEIVFATTPPEGATITATFHTAR